VKVKLDENMPSALAERLRSAGHDVATVPDERLGGAADPTVLGAATSEGRLLMTFDTDFANIRLYPPGSHAGIIVFRLHDLRWKILGPPVARLMESGVLERLHGGLAIVDEVRTRMRAGRRDEEP
jgi:predicted nuclease of predicted toxin-antitoxin system